MGWNNKISALPDGTYWGFGQETAINFTSRRIRTAGLSVNKWKLSPRESE